MFKNRKLTAVSYGWAIATYVLIGLGIISGINGIVDPFGRFGWVQIEGINLLKPGFDRNPLMSKAFHSAIQQPDSVVLGTSRANQGYDPQNDAWQTVADRPYNLGTPAADIYRMRRYFQHIQARSPVRQLILALDFRSFNAYDQRITNNEATDTGEVYLAVDDQGQPKPFYGLTQVLPSLLSKDALMASLYTLSHQSGELDRTYFPNGFKFRDPDTFTPRRRFLYGAGRSVGVYMARPNRDHAYGYRFVDETRGYSTLEDYRYILRTAYEADIDVRIVINPSHGYLLEVIHAIDLWPTFEDWKRSLLAINLEEAAAAHAEPFPLWDFCDYSPVATQNVPEKRKQWDRSPQPFWEITHFKPSVGDRVLQALFEPNGSNPNKADPNSNISKMAHPETILPAALRESSESNGFGTRLTAANLELHLAAVRDRRRDYVRHHRSEINQVKRRCRRALENL